MFKIKRNRRSACWEVIDNEGYIVITTKLPSQARFKARMWYMYLTTGEMHYLYKEKP